MVEVPVARPREPSQFLSSAFIATRRHLEELIHGQRASSVDALPRFRRCQADEDVK
jgi:hypothetical protein